MDVYTPYPWMWTLSKRVVRTLVAILHKEPEFRGSMVFSKKPHSVLLPQSCGKKTSTVSRKLSGPTTFLRLGLRWS